jgi:hypothetical protein
MLNRLSVTVIDKLDYELLDYRDLYEDQAKRFWEIKNLIN